MKVKPKDLLNKRFGRLFVLKLDLNKNGYLICNCDCGNQKSIISNSLIKTNGTKSCGCLAKEISSLVHVKDLIGNRYGKLLVINRCGSDTLKHARWNCQCDCGNYKIVSSNNLRKNGTVSCGCAVIDFLKTEKPNVKHGLHNSREYKSYYSILQRCLNIKCKEYPYYGGRGIKVCSRWLESFDNFIQDMGMMPNNNLTIERVDVNGNYCHSNCIWDTMKNQSRNRRNNVWLSYNNINMCQSDWALYFKTSHVNIINKIKIGKSMEYIYNFYNNKKILPNLQDFYNSIYKINESKVR